MADQMTLEQFGAAIKAKYPDYASVPDAEIGRRMLDKYPEYRERVQTADFTSSNEKDAAGNAVVRLGDGSTVDTSKLSPDVAAGFRQLASGNTDQRDDILNGPAADYVRGGVSGLMSTLFHGGDVIRRATGMERVIDTPEAQAAMTSPQNMPGRMGKFTEQSAEFLAPLGAVSKGTAAIGWLPRLAAEAATNATMAGIQTGGDPKAMGVATALTGLVPVLGAAKNAAVRAAAGAEEGGLGGAIAGAVREAAPVKPQMAIIQALKPRNSRVLFPETLDRSLREVAAVADATGEPIQSLDALLNATKLAKRNVRAQYDAIAGPMREAGFTVDLSPVADAMERSVPRKVMLENPAAANAVSTAAAPYRQRFDLEDAEQLLRETNAELEAYYSKFPAARRAAETNPDTAALVAQGKALREAIYKTLDSAKSGPARELQRRYGALMELEDAALRRSNVAARQQPESLSEQIGQVRAAADIARGLWKVGHLDLAGAADIAAGYAGKSTAKFLKEQQTTDALIRRAFEAFKDRPIPIQAPPMRVPYRGLLNSVMEGEVIPSSGEVIAPQPLPGGRLALPGGVIPQPGSPLPGRLRLPADTRKPIPLGPGDGV